MVKVSVIIPTYKPKAYLRECLESLAKQTLDKSLYELVVVLNGCKDPWQEQLEKLLAEFPLQSTLIQTDRPGVSNARNIGLEQARGEYIAFVDDDDWVSPEYLEDMLAKSSSGCIVVSNEMDYNAESDTYTESYITRAFKRNKPFGKVSLFKGRSLMSSSCCKLIPREVIGTRRFDTSITLSEDSLFMTSISSKVQGIILADSGSVYYRRVHNASSSRRVNLKDRRSQALKVIKTNVRLYFSDVRHNNIPFYISRIVAALMKLLKKTWI